MNTLIGKSSAVFPLTFMMVSALDGVSPATGLTPTVVISKNGGAFATPGGAVSELANGWYLVAPNATDSNTLGPLILHATASGAINSDNEYLVVGFDPTAAAASVNVVQAAGQTVSATAAVNFDQIGFIGETTVRRGTCQSGSTSTTIVFDSGASSQSNYYVDMMAVIVGGTGAGQARLITAYNQSTQTATIYPAWTSTPDNTSKFLIVSETQADVGRLANVPVIASSEVIFPAQVAGSGTGARVGSKRWTGCFRSDFQSLFTAPAAIPRIHRHDLSGDGRSMVGGRNIQQPAVLHRQNQRPLYLERWKRLEHHLGARTWRGGRSELADRQRREY